MYMVYWTVVDANAQDGAASAACQQLFDSADMLAAMALMEQLRTRQRAGEGIHFVSMASENPDSIGHAGVDVTGPDYDWTKRRKR